MSPITRSAVLLSWLFAVGPSDAFAANRDWSGGLLGDGQFVDPNSWFDGVPTNNTTSDVARFYGFFDGLFSGPINTTVNLNVARSVRGLEFIAPTAGGAAVNFTFTGAKLTVGEDGIDALIGAGNNHVINNDIGLATNQQWHLDRNLTVHGVLSGTGQLDKTGQGTLTLTASNTNTDGFIIYDGTLRLTGGGRISDQATVTMTDGTLRLEGMTDAIGTLSGGGTIALLSGARLGIVQGNGAISKRGPGTFLLSGDNTYTGGTRVESGILVINKSSPFATNSATGTGAVVVTSGGSLGGLGIAEGTVTIETDSTIFPGGDGVRITDRTGLLTVLDLTLDAGATLAIDLGGTLPGVTYDVLAAADAALAGSLNVSLVGGFVPSPGQEFQILAATESRTGTFAGLPQGAVVREIGAVDLTIDYTGEGGLVVSLIAGLRGDFNGDGTVDAADYTVWRDGLGGKYTLSDYEKWKGNFGASIVGAAGIASTTAVPESSALGLLAAGIFAISLRKAARIPR
jgi:autotransporter-associated beta strand protein